MAYDVEGERPEVHPGPQFRQEAELGWGGVRQIAGADHRVKVA